MIAGMTKPTQAVVIGASMAGLLAACALSETFDRVVLVERDHLPDDASDRRGVPQGKHLHGLLAGGFVALNNLFPGFEADLLVAGAVRSDVQSDIHWWVDGHLIKPEPSGIIGFSCSRRLLEHTVRERVKALPEVEIIDHCDVLGIVSTDAGETIGGVRIISKADSAEASELPADLVIDASGRASRSSRWLTALGFQPAEETRIPVDITYVTREYRRESGQLDGRAGTSTGSYPGLPIGAFLLALEDDTFMLTAGGIYGETPPMDDDGFAEFAAKLPTRDFADFLRTATRISDPLKLHYPVSVRKHYERLTDFPAGYLVVGDALCSFNPIFAQGMSVAAAEAVLLRDLLSAGSVNLAADFFGGAAEIIDVPWLIAVNADLRYPQAKVAQTDDGKALDEYLRLVYRAASVDRTVATAIVRVINLLDTPERLLEPAMVARVMEIAQVNEADVSDPVRSETPSVFPILSASKAVC
jgi:2-polyprenyl-6-methoxyphenol hydroxylase-like FAD-dependent oxidoreductase